MKIICTLEERNNLMEIVAGCCWIGSGEVKYKNWKEKP